MTWLYLFAFIVVATAVVLVIGVGASIGWGLYLAWRWLRRRYIAWRNDRMLLDEIRNRRAWRSLGRMYQREDLQ